jgi:predicted nucleotidyltransferase
MQVQRLSLELSKIFLDFEVEVAYLFGSKAHGRDAEDSDFDFGVLFNKNLNSDQRFKLQLRLADALENHLKKDVDVISIDDTMSILLKFVIISEGKLIYCSSEDRRFNFELVVLNEYIDYKPFMDAYNRAYVAASQR